MSKSTSRRSFPGAAGGTVVMAGGCSRPAPPAGARKAPANPPKLAIAPSPILHRAAGGYPASACPTPR